MTSAPHIVFAGGGTAGHLFPGLATAERLVAEHPEWRITFVGTGKAFERELVVHAGFEYLGLPCRPLPTHPGEALRFLADNLTGFYAANWFLRGEKVSVVIGTGGYGSIPMVRAAARRRIPFVLLEQNAVPGRATRWLAPSARLVCGAFEEIRNSLKPGCRVRITGNPVRSGFARDEGLVAPTRSSGSRRPRMLVLGGSSGAHTLNQHVPRAIYKAGPSLQGWEIIHQTGEREAGATRELYGKLGLEAAVTPFIEDMESVLTAADLVISRAGGTTIAELAVAGVPAVLVPYPQAAENHQRKNADALAALGGCQVLDEREISGRFDNHLAELLAPLAEDGQLRGRMSAALRRHARPDAAQVVARIVADQVQSRHLACVA